MRIYDGKRTVYGKLYMINCIYWYSISSSMIYTKIWIQFWWSYSRIKQIRRVRGDYRLILSSDILLLYRNITVWNYGLFLLIIRSIKNENMITAEGVAAQTVPISNSTIWNSLFPINFGLFSISYTSSILLSILPLVLIKWMATKFKILIWPFGW